MAMSSRERMLAAINHVEPDRVPLLVGGLDPVLPAHLRCDNKLEQMDRLLAMGIDETLMLITPSRMHPDVRTRTWSEHPSQERYPLQYKVYETPEGELMQVVRKSEDWRAGDDVALVDHHNIQRSVRFLVETEEDLARLPYVFAAPSEDQIRSFRQEAKETKKAADERGVLLQGHVRGGGCDVAIQICGLENFIVATKERPQFAKEVLRILHELEMIRLELVLDAGACDVILRSGWSENRAYWSPADYRRWFYDDVKAEVELVHQAGLKYDYALNLGIMGMAPDLLSLGVDVVAGVDPVQGGADLDRLKRECGDRICFLGGMNSYLTLGRGDREEIREAVRNAIHTLGPGGGLILSPVDALDHTTPWSNVEIMLEAWREYSGYPLSV